jgi:hypothetical protein
MAPLTGTDTYNAKLNEDQVKLARIWVEKGPVGTLPQIAKRWNVQSQTLRNAVNGKNWKWLPAPTADELAATPLPDWLELSKAPHRAKCGHCVHWDTERSCTLGFPESGGFVASACAAFYNPSGN